MVKSSVYIKKETCIFSYPPCCHLTKQVSVAVSPKLDSSFSPKAVRLLNSTIKKNSFPRVAQRDNNLHFVAKDNTHLSHSLFTSLTNDTGVFAAVPPPPD